MSSKRFELAGGYIPYLELGDPEGRPLVIVPGLSDGLGSVEGKWVGRLTRMQWGSFTGFRTVVVSRRVPTPMGSTIADMADDVAGLLRGLGMAPAAVIGESMGGMIAQELAVRHPDVVGRLVLAVTVAYADDHLREVVDRWESLARQRRWKESARDAIAMTYTGGSPLLRAPLAWLLGLLPKPAELDRYFAHCEAVRRFDARALLKLITCPALVVGGEADILTRPEKVRELASGIPGSELVMLRRAGHAAVMQRKRQFHSAVTKFLVSP